MKGFLLFLLFSFGLIAAYIIYEIYNPPKTEYIKKGLRWIPVEVNRTKEPKH